MKIRTAFVTGGSRGIGAAIVRALAPCCNVAFTYRSSEAEARAGKEEESSLAAKIYTGKTA